MTTQLPDEHHPCDELYDLLPLYSIGATTADENKRVQSLMDACPEVAAEFDEFVTLSAGIAQTVEPMTPPPNLKANLMAAIAAEEEKKEEENHQPDNTALIHPYNNVSPATEAVPMMPESTSAPSNNILQLPIVQVLAVALVALVAGNVYFFQQWQTAQTNATTQQAELSDTRDQLNTALDERAALSTELTVASENLDTVTAELAAARAQFDDALTFALSSTTQRIDLGEEAPIATVLWNQQTDEAAIATDSLPALGDEQTYQVWLVGEEDPISAGTFDVAEGDQAFYTFTPAQSLSAFASIAVSIEPVGGSPAPTTDPIAVGTIFVPQS